MVGIGRFFAVWRMCKSDQSFLTVLFKSRFAVRTTSFNPSTEIISAIWTAEGNGSENKRRKGEQQPYAYKRGGFRCGADDEQENACCKNEKKNTIIVLWIGAHESCTSYKTVSTSKAPSCSLKIRSTHIPSISRRLICSTRESNRRKGHRRMAFSSVSQQTASGCGCW